MGVGALDLIFGVCEEGFEVTVGGGNAVDEVFKNESKSEAKVSFREYSIGGSKRILTSAIAPETPSRLRKRDC